MFMLYVEVLQLRGALSTCHGWFSSKSTVNVIYDILVVRSCFHLTASSWRILIDQNVMRGCVSPYVTLAIGRIIPCPNDATTWAPYVACYMSQSRHQLVLMMVSQHICIQMTDDATDGVVSTAHQHLVGNLVPSIDWMSVWLRMKISGDPTTVTEFLVDAPTHKNSWTCPDHFEEITDLSPLLKED